MYLLISFAVGVVVVVSPFMLVIMMSNGFNEYNNDVPDDKSMMMMMIMVARFHVVSCSVNLKLDPEYKTNFEVKITNNFRCYFTGISSNSGGLLIMSNYNASSSIDSMIWL